VIGHRLLRLLPPPVAAGRLAGIARNDRPAELQRLLREDGLLGFDLFAGLTADLLEQSPRLCRILADCHPIIILDEFQDTNLDEWRMIAALGQHSQLIALADAEQRIYEFRGADPARMACSSTGSSRKSSTSVRRIIAATVLISLISVTTC
jgi:DNA helicase II / ATP-dependent DNA helicase PcrA